MAVIAQLHPGTPNHSCTLEPPITAAPWNPQSQLQLTVFSNSSLIELLLLLLLLLLFSSRNLTELLLLLPLPLPPQVFGNRTVIKMQEWLDLINKYREEEEDIMGSLPVEALLGLYRVDCRALQRRLLEAARSLQNTILLSLQEDLLEAASTTHEKLQVGGGGVGG